MRISTASGHSAAIPRRISLLVTSFCKKNKNIFSHHQVALESLNYDHSTQNQKLHQTVVIVCSRKKSPLTVTFHS